MKSKRQKWNPNRAKMAVARKMVADLLAVDRGQREFIPAEQYNSAAAGLAFLPKAKAAWNLANWPSPPDTLAGLERQRDEGFAKKREKNLLAPVEKSTEARQAVDIYTVLFTPLHQFRGAHPRHVVNEP